jgi:vacuolar protein sorting-associated protein 13B
LGLSDGLSQGLTGFGISMLSAVGGLAHHTLQATSPVGVVTGMVLFTLFNLLFI